MTIKVFSNLRQTPAKDKILKKVKQNDKNISRMMNCPYLHGFVAEKHNLHIEQIKAKSIQLFENIYL